MYRIRMMKFFVNTLNVNQKNILYTSLLVQNEIIDCIHKYILNEILHRVENCLFSIIVDETADISTGE